MIVNSLYKICAVTCPNLRPFSEYYYTLKYFKGCCENCKWRDYAVYYSTWNSNFLNGNFSSLLFNKNENSLIKIKRKASII